MKIITIRMLTAAIGIFSGGQAAAQDDAEAKPPAPNPLIQKLDRFERLDSSAGPITDQNIDDFCALFRSIPMSYETMEATKVTHRKIHSAWGLYDECKSQDQKKKIVDVLLELFPIIQAERDKLGVNPLSKTESNLYFDPPVPLENAGPSPSEQMIANQRKLGEMATRRNLLAAQIGNLNTIHKYLYRTLTRQMKVPVEGISFELERSPAEKARTKEVLERQAAERLHPPLPETKEENQTVPGK